MATLKERKKEARKAKRTKNKEKQEKKERKKKKKKLFKVHQKFLTPLLRQKLSPQNQIPKSQQK